MLLQLLYVKLSRNDASFFSPFAKQWNPRIFRVTGANQNVRKLLSIDLANTKYMYWIANFLIPTLNLTSNGDHSHRFQWSSWGTRTLLLEGVTKSNKITWASILSINMGSDPITAEKSRSLLPIKFGSRSCRRNSKHSNGLIHFVWPLFVSLRRRRNSKGRTNIQPSIEPDFGYVKIFVGSWGDRYRVVKSEEILGKFHKFLL